MDAKYRDFCALLSAPLSSFLLSLYQNIVISRVKHSFLSVNPELTCVVLHK